MTTKIQKWGNSYAVRLPKKLVVKLGLTLGSPVVIGEDRDTVVVKKAPTNKTETIQDWKKYLIPMKKAKKGKKDNVSERVDEILYGKSAR